ncbi:hypothetical protein M427DRAFT_50593 [Gonapodya prolifera JEL478]|uniref:Uncharacterized protein n=1 Tax=Gonapodya prolifera (strain JEL478) TaxID=1344416 RepID=A0A139AZY9_GONPJ|nr:hypothetical protein M427DRAFT_50593 [Gonapodya prolifera JEL478]|eukprot:KXS22260.1 hypothetical protein M427DRAFT_50593 [Gonapodya prolifera JEL478]
MRLGTLCCSRLGGSRVFAAMAVLVVYSMIVLVSEKSPFDQARELVMPRSIWSQCGKCLEDLESRHPWSASTVAHSRNAQRRLRDRLFWYSCGNNSSSSPHYSPGIVVADVDPAAGLGNSIQNAVSATALALLSGRSLVIATPLLRKVFTFPQGAKHDAFDALGHCGWNMEDSQTIYSSDRPLDLDTLDHQKPVWVYRGGWLIGWREAEECALACILRDTVPMPMRLMNWLHSLENASDVVAPSSSTWEQPYQDLTTLEFEIGSRLMHLIFESLRDSSSCHSFCFKGYSLSALSESLPEGNHWQQMTFMNESVAPCTYSELTKAISPYTSIHFRTYSSAFEGCKEDTDYCRHHFDSARYLREFRCVLKASKSVSEHMSPHHNIYLASDEPRIRDIALQALASDSQLWISSRWQTTPEKPRVTSPQVEHVVETDPLLLVHDGAALHTSASALAALTASGSPDTPDDAVSATVREWVILSEAELLMANGYSTFSRTAYMWGRNPAFVTCGWIWPWT